MSSPLLRSCSTIFFHVQYPVVLFSCWLFSPCSGAYDYLAISCRWCSVILAMLDTRHKSALLSGASWIRLRMRHRKSMQFTDNCVVPCSVVSSAMRWRRFMHVAPGGMRWFQPRWGQAPSHLVISCLSFSGVAGPLAARGGGQICRPFVLGFGNWELFKARVSIRRNVDSRPCRR